MQHLDLFSGIGGFALATEMVWGRDNVSHTFCDIDPFSQAILKKHWPDAMIYGDIRSLTANSEWQRTRGVTGKHPRSSGARKSTGAELRKKHGNKTGHGDTRTIDLLTGGFPCQPFSQAGKRRGTEDDRHLWPEMLRVIREFHPRWVIGENVGGFVTWNGGMVLEQVHADLESEGYEVQAFIIPACGLDAPHRRDRVWIVGRNTKCLDGRSETRGNLERNVLSKRKRQEITDTPHGSDIDATDSAQRGWGQGNPDAGGGSERTTAKKKRSRSADRTGWSEAWSEIASRLCRVDDGIPKRLDRNLRLKGLGNAVVPQVAAEIMRAIKL